MNPKKTGVFIAALRKEAGLTQKELAEKLNVSDKAISRWETGKGYPDIESLMALSELFSVSVNELLGGKRHESTAIAKIAEQEIAVAYIQTIKNRRFFKKFVLTILSVFALAIVLIGLPVLYTHVMGSPNCVIASDYSSIMIYGERYVPLKLDGVQCQASELLIEEAQVEGSYFIGKLLFGEMIYSVKNCPNNDIIYLQSEYDYLISEYYCKESMLEHYIVLSQQADCSIYTAEIQTEYGTQWDFNLEPSLAEMIINEDYSPTTAASNTMQKGDADITVHFGLENSPFIRYEGYFKYRNGKYYWIDWPDPGTYGVNQNAPTYEIDRKYYDALNRLFSYMN